MVMSKLDRSEFDSVMVTLEGHSNLSIGLGMPLANADFCQDY